MKMNCHNKMCPHLTSTITTCVTCLLLDIQKRKYIIEHDSHYLFLNLNIQKRKNIIEHDSHYHL